MAGLGDHVEDLAALCDAGLFLRAKERAAAVPWAEVEARPALAREIARALYHLGAHSLSDALTVATFRRHPRDAVAQALWLREVAERRGPLEGWLAAARLPEPLGADAHGRARLALARAAIHVGLRDDEGATRHLDAARDVDPIGALELDVARHLHADRAEDALALVRAAPPEVRGRYGVVLAHAGLLASHDRLEDALAVLRDQRGSECSAISAMQLTLERELERYADAEATFAELVRRTPLADREARAWRDGIASELAYARGDRLEAARLAEACGTPFHLRVAASMRAASGLRRVRHHVPFVRQDWMTCAPATLTGLSCFFGREAEHDAIANAICYDGTPSHAQRRWAEEAGFACRELTVTWDAAQALLDAGLPFALTTVEAGSAHVRAVVGYDEARRTLLFRETHVPILVECLADELFDRYRAHGPRGLVIARGPAAERLAAMELPDAERYDLLHRAHVALDAHDRAKAAELLGALARPGATPDAIDLAGARVLASYDGDGGRLLEVARRSVAAFPEDPAMRAFLAGCLEGAASHEERTRELEAAARLSKEPIWDELLGAELAGDARRSAEASRRLRRGARNGSRPRAVAELGMLAVRRGEGQRGRDLLKLAYCIDPLHEGIALALARELSTAGRASEAKALLARRHEELGARSAAPTITWLDWLAETGDHAGQSAAIDAALARRPDDGALACAAASHLARLGEVARAAELLARFAGRARGLDHLHATARVREASGDAEAALEAYRAILELDPADASAHAALAAAAASRDGARASLRYLDAVAEGRPYDLRLAHARAQAARAVSPEEHDRVTAEIVGKHPDSAWALRERALALSDVGRRDEARAVFEGAAAREPSSSARFSTEGFLLQAVGDSAGALEAFRRALAADPDAPGAMRVLASAATELGCEVDELRKAFTIARDRTIDGTAVLGWVDLALGMLPEDELRQRAGELRAARPDLWAASLAEAEVARGANETRRARELLDDALARFPRAATLWVRRAALAVEAGDDDGARTALGAALRIAPTRSDALRSLARLEEASGDASAAARLRARALAAAPLAAPLVVADARERAAAGDVDGARSRLEAFLAVCTDSEEAWSALFGLDADRAVDVARELATRRPWDESAHVMLAELRAARGDLPGAIDGLRSLAQPVRESAAVKERLGMLLADAGRTDEALAECPEEGHFTVIGRRADVLCRVGKTAEARALLERAVGEHPGYLWGLAQLARVCEALDDAPGALRAAQRIAAIRPDDAVAQQDLARAAARARKPKAARRAWIRAHRLAPGDPSIGAAAMRALLDADAIDDAREVHTRLGRAATGRDAEVRRRLVAYYRVELAAVAGDARAAEEALEAVARDPRSTESDIATARRELVAAGMLEAADRALDRALDAEATSPDLAPHVVRVASLARRAPAVIVRSGRTPLAVERLTAACVVWLEAHASGAQLLRFVAPRLRDLARSSLGWAAVGAALVARGWPRAAVVWMRDWRARGDAPAKALVALARALETLGRARVAMEVAEAAMARDPSAATAARIETIQAFFAACRGEALERGQRADDAFHRAVDELTEAMQSLRGAASAQRPRLYALAKRRVDELTGALEPRVAAQLEPFVARCLLRLARDARDPSDFVFYGARFVPWKTAMAAGLATLVVYMVAQQPAWSLQPYMTRTSLSAIVPLVLAIAMGARRGFELFLGFAAGRRGAAR